MIIPKKRATMLSFVYVKHGMCSDEDVLSNHMFGFDDVVDLFTSLHEVSHTKENPEGGPW